MQEIKTISLSLPFRLGVVNCYLVQTETGYVLIDTGSTNMRGELEHELENAGCRPGDLGLILLTHGDFDHAGNAAYLGEKFGAQIAIHRDDAGMVERGDMFWNRQTGNVLMRWLSPILFGFGKTARFKPDICVEDGYDLSTFGFEARVVAIPGHSKGSIGILTTDGSLFCGDLFENLDKPGLGSIMDDLDTANVSVEKVKGLGINTVYPGHGDPFQIDLLA